MGPLSHPPHLPSLYQQSSSPSSLASSCSSGTTVYQHQLVIVRKWKQRDTIQPSSSPQVGPLCHPLTRSPVFDLSVSLLVLISLPSHRSPAICLRPFDPTSIEARPKNAPVLRNDALPGLPAPRTGHRVFAGERQCGRRIATSIGPRPPTLQTFGVPGAQVGSPAPCDGTRHELVPRPIEPVLRL